jgi:hypothetical protein
MTQPACTGVRKEQYPHRFRQTVVRGRKIFFENVITRRTMGKGSRRIDKKAGGTASARWRSEKFKMTFITGDKHKDTAIQYQRDKV